MTTYDYPVVDIHTHCWVDSFASRVLQHFLDNVHLPATFDGTFAGLKTSMDDAGIAASVVLPVPTKPSQVDRYNDFMVQFIDNPRYIPFAAVHPDEDDPVYTIHRAARAGFTGVKLHPLNQKFNPQEPRMFPIYDAIIEEGMAMLFHAGAGFKVRSEFGCHDDFAAFFDVYSDYDRIVVAHMGGPYDHQTPPKPEPDWPCLYDVAFLMNNYEPDRVVELIDTVGCDRVLFGTDAPWHSQKADLAAFRELPYSPEQIRAMTSDNALRFLGRTADSIGPDAR